MPLSPGQLLLMRRKGPGMTPGGAAPMAPAPISGGGPAGGPPDLGQALGKILASLGGGRQDFLMQLLENWKRTMAVSIAKYAMEDAETTRHINRAFTAVDAAINARKKRQEASQQQGSQAGPPLGFTGAAMGVSNEDNPSQGAAA